MERSVSVSAGIIAVVALFAALYSSTTILAPVACALFIVAVVWPLQKLLQSYLPQLVALAITLCVVALAFSIFALVVSWGFGRIGRSLIADAPRFQVLYERGVTWLDGHGIAVAGIWAEHFNMSLVVRAVQGITGRLNTIISFWLVVLVYVLLGLLEVEVSARKVFTFMRPDNARSFIDGCSTTAAKFRRYILIRTLMSVITGVLVWLLAYAMGLKLAAEWGVIAFTLNYIPFIGPFVATLLPTLYALAQFESLQSALLIFACLNVIQFVVGSYIEPRVAGRALAASPFMVLFSVFLWMFLWGLFGAFIGVPILIALLTFCAQYPSTKWLAGLLGASDDAAEVNAHSWVKGPSG